MPGNIDIIARLRLNAEEFSNGYGKAMSGLVASAERASAEVKRPFLQAFADVNASAQRALTLPRNTSGALDLSSEIASLNSASLAAEQHAIALRQMSVAKLAVAEAGRGDAEALRLEAGVAIEAARASEQAAEQDRARAAALEATQAELNKMVGAQERVVTSTRGVTNSTGAMRFAMSNASFQIQDTFTQLSLGANAFQVVAIQGGQLAGAFANIEGKAGSVARFFIGPWGLALTGAALVAGPLITKLFEQSDAAETLAKDMATAASAADSFGNAESLIGRIIDLATGKLKTHNAVLIETIRLQAEAGLVAAQDAERKARGTIKDVGENSFLDNIAGFGGLDPAGNAMPSDPYAGGNIYQANSGLRSLRDEILSGKETNPTEIRQRVDAMVAAGQLAGKSAKDIIELKKQLYTLPQALTDKKAYQQALDAIDGKGVSSDLKPYSTGNRGGGGRASPKAREDTATSREVDAIAKIKEQWIDQPKLVKRVADANGELDKILADIEKRKPPGFEKMIADIGEARKAIDNGLNRPFNDYVKAQEESLAIGKLTLQGRDAEAEALQYILGLQHAGAEIDSERIARAESFARQQERIRDAIEDQNRIVNVATGTVHQMQQSFDQFLSDLENRPTKALATYAGSFVDSFKQLQRGLLSNAIFGGVDRDIAKYVRELTGQQTPKEIIDKQAEGAGTALKNFADTVEGITFRLGGGLDALTGAAKGGAGIPASSAIQAILNANAANDNGDGQDIVVRAIRTGKDADLKTIEAVQIFAQIADRIETNLDKIGVHIPAAIAKALPSALQGASIFSSIGAGFGGQGGTYGGILGAGIGSLLPKLSASIGQALPIYQLAESVTLPIAKALGLDKTNTQLGGLVGGIIGKVFGIGPKINYGNAGLSLGAYGQVAGGGGTGRGSGSPGVAAASASGVASSVNAILDQLGATVSSLAPLTVGTWDGKYRVATVNTTAPLNGNSAAAKAGQIQDFGGDQDAAIAYAVQYELSHAIITGISEASQKIIASGGDIQASLAKVMLIEAIPKDLKAMLDPLGAAIDDLNRKWARTVQALDEGGASAEQYAQAEQLYKLQLDQVKASTASASQSLKDFRDSLNFGSNSPYSFRDQEASSKAALQPFLDTIVSGGTVDQAKYQSAAQSFLDIERQIYGSTQDYFDALDSIQAATSKAISSIDNAVPITPGVPDPFTKATADAVQTGNEMAEDTNALLRQNNALLSQLLGAVGNSGSDYIGTTRGFLANTA